MPRKAREIPWLDKRGEQYYACWYDSGSARTRRLSLRTTDAREARGRFAAWLIECEDEYAGTERKQPARLTVGSMIDDYLREHVDVSCAAPKRQHFAAARLRAFFDTYSAADVDIAACRRYMDHRRAMGVTDATIRRELSALAAAMKHAVKWKRLARNDLPVIEHPDDSDPKTLVLSRAQIMAIADAGTPEVRLFTLIAYFTASRRAAVETLSWFQVDLERGMIALAKPGERKTNKRRPDVPIDQELYPHLAAAREAARTEWVLGAPINRYRPWKEAAKAAGAPAEATPHTLRHSRVTHLLEAGVDIWSVAKLVGDRVQTIDRVYGHASMDHLKKVLREKSG